MTWEAYNRWGGGSLYDGDDGGFGDRSLAVSFDRPYDTGYGAGRFAYYDLPIAKVAERLGLPLAYTTDYDLDLDPACSPGHRSRRRRSRRVLDGQGPGRRRPRRGARGNLAVFGANTAYWRARLAGRSVGLAGQPGRRDGRPRLVVVTKDAHSTRSPRRDPGGSTARFRDRPAPRPRSSSRACSTTASPRAAAGW